MKSKLVYVICLIVLVASLLASCAPAADVASQNVSTAADNFEVFRRITFINGITDKYLLVIEGYCSLGNNDPAKELSVTCKIGPTSYYKDFLGLSDNVTYIVQQTEPVNANPYQYRVIFRPSEIIPDIQVQPSVP